METPYWSPSRLAPTWRPKTNRNIDRNINRNIEFGYKSVNLSLEELKNIKLILFLIHELFR